MEFKLRKAEARDVSDILRLVKVRRVLGWLNGRYPVRLRATHIRLATFSRLGFSLCFIIGGEY